MRGRLIGLSWITALLPFLGSGVWADDTVYLKRDASLCDTYKAFHVSSEECADSSGGETLGASRSIRLREPSAPAPLSRPQANVSIPVLFKFDSYALSPESEAQLDTIARVIEGSELADRTILLEGYADASGGAQYNLQLSRKRAAAVRQYLVDKHGLDISRLPIEGKGESDLRDPLNPLSESNRRVEFVVN